MNFIKFNVATTNIFPIANTTNGGQLVTEFNLRTRESVASSENVKYMSGQSFVHSNDDFYVSAQASSTEYFPDDVQVSSSVLEISDGCGVINGHFVESLVPITIDMIDAAESAASIGETLRGNLSVGLKAMYSTERTIAGSILSENSDEMYEGIQVIILPTESFILPEDSPTDPSQVTAHILLATFQYYDGVISNVVNNYPAKCQMLDAVRVKNISEIISDSYPSKSGLNPKKFYTLAGKCDPNTWNWSIEWCDATSSTMVWDTEIPEIVDAAPAIRTARFIQNQSNGVVSLVVPHKQIDGMANDSQFFAPAVLPFPVADFNTGTPGAVDSTYTQNVKSIVDKINDLYNLPNGKQRGYYDELSNRNNLPFLNPDWDIGDYILIGQDSTIDYTLADSARKPSTIYAVIPGFVSEIKYVGQDFDTLPFEGTELARLISSDRPIINKPDDYNTKYWNLGNYRGVVNKDYFVYEYDNNGTTTLYYFMVSASGSNNYSSPILITGGTPLASENAVGGFYNSPASATDGGYVYLDSNGYLRLRDYALLRSGTLAYQLGEDYTVPKGLTLSEIQKYLDEYVNQRVAFPTASTLYTTSENRVTVYIDISDTSEGSINIYGLDSRFNTSVRLYITASSDVKCTVNIVDCEKIQVATSIVASNITLNVYRSRLYYDATILDFVNNIQDFTIWYDRFSDTDPILSVEGMTISQLVSDGIYGDSNIENVSDWSNININDNHFSVALQSITLSSDGYVTGCGVLVRNSSTSNVRLGKSITQSSFTLPQGPNLSYPTSRLVRPIDVTGEFISAYVDQSNDTIVQDTKFSLLTQKYTSTGVVDGHIAFLVDAYSVAVSNSQQINEWSPSRFHYFNGKTMF